MMRKRRRRRRTSIQMGIRVLFCDIDWATDEGKSNREIVNFKPDRNKMTWLNSDFLLVDYL